MPQIKTSIFGILFFSCTIHLWCQVSLFGDLYIGENKEFHIAFSETYFSGGKIKTHREEPSGVVSFGSKSKWTQLDENSYVDGKVRIYHNGIFTFPIGNSNWFSPITFYITENTHYVQVEYAYYPERIFTSNSTEFEIPQYHFWNWDTEGNPFARLQTFWWPENRLKALLNNQEEIHTLNMGILFQNNWEKYASSIIANPYTPEYPLSLDYGSSIGLEPIPLNTFTALTYLIKKREASVKKLISQVITPNGDGINDTWKIQGYEFNSKSQIKVYALNLELVYSKIGEYQNDWNGIAIPSGKPLSNGSYFYTLDLDGIPPLEKKGWVYIKRN